MGWRSTPLISGVWADRVAWGWTWPWSACWWRSFLEDWLWPWSHRRIILPESFVNIWKNTHRPCLFWMWSKWNSWMAWEASTFDLCFFPFFHTAIVLFFLPKGCFTSFSIPIPLIHSLCCFTQHYFMLLWSPSTIIDDKPCSMSLRFLAWTNLTCGKLKFHWPFSDLRIEHPWRGRWFRRRVISGRRHHGPWRCCFGRWRSWCSCLSCIHNIGHFCHPRGESGTIL